MEKLTTLTAYIETELSKLEIPSQPSDLYDPIRYILKLGGKRIRPILTILGAEMFDMDRSKSIDQALAIELFHNFTLIHDDIMDAAPLRRKQETVHTKWNSNVGILSGDAMLIMAYQQLAKSRPETLPDILDLFNRTSIEVCEGQQMDMDFEERIDVSTAEYIEMIRLKTSVLLGCALQMGAIVANASKLDQAELYSFGVNVGIAFQIQDDILDLYADPEKFGKQVGGDVIANKKTILHLTAVSKASEGQLLALKQLQLETNNDIKIARTREIFDHLNVRQACEELQNHYFNLAVTSLDRINVDDDHKATLKFLGEYLMNRAI